MFYDDPRVLYFSIHRYEHGTFWPNLRESDFDCIGEGKGTGYNFNLPLNKTGMNNADYLAIWQQILLPVAAEVTILFLDDEQYSFEIYTNLKFRNSFNRIWSSYRPAMMQHSAVLRCVYFYQFPILFFFLGVFPELSLYRN